VDSQSFLSLLTLSKEFNTLLKKLINDQKFTFNIYCESFIISCIYFKKTFYITSDSYDEEGRYRIDGGIVANSINNFIEFATINNITKVKLIQHSIYSILFESFETSFRRFPNLKRIFILSDIVVHGFYHYRVIDYVNIEYKQTCDDFKINPRVYGSTLSVEFYCDIFKLPIDMEVVSLFNEIIIADSIIYGDVNGVYNISENLSADTQVKKITFKNCCLHFKTINANVQIAYIDCYNVEPHN
jgi:hypothetical protein